MKTKSNEISGAAALKNGSMESWGYAHILAHVQMDGTTRAQQVLTAFPFTEASPFIETNEEFIEFIETVITKGVRDPKSQFRFIKRFDYGGKQQHFAVLMSRSSPGNILTLHPVFDWVDTGGQQLLLEEIFPQGTDTDGSVTEAFFLVNAGQTKFLAESFYFEEHMGQHNPAELRNRELTANICFNGVFIKSKVQEATVEAIKGAFYKINAKVVAVKSQPSLGCASRIALICDCGFVFGCIITPEKNIKKGDYIAGAGKFILHNEEFKRTGAEQ